MKRARIFLSLLLPLLAGCTLQEPLSVPDAPAPEVRDSHIPGVAVLLLSEEAAGSFDLAAFPGATKALGITAAERVFPPAGEFEERHRAAGLHRWYRVNYDPGVARTKAVADLEAIPGVEAVSFPRRKVTRALFNDPYSSYQWNFVNAGGKGYKKDFDINVLPVWQQYTGGSSNVIVAVVDSGVDLKHEDLKGVVLSAPDYSRNFIAGYSPGTIPSGDHGTHVGGVIGAINNNGKGVCGIAGGLDGKGGVRLMSCVILAGTDEDPEGGEGTEDAEALVWAADHGAVIANNSWGYEVDTEEDAAELAQAFIRYDSPTKSAIDYFIDYAGMDTQGRQTGPMKGGVVFFASGNQGFAHDAPSEYERVIAVGAVGPDGKMSLYSNYGPWVDILAPGGSDSEDNSDEWILSCVPDDGSEYAPYAFMAGTSMACPHAAGVAALLVSHFGGPGFTNDQLKAALLGGARENDVDLLGRTVGGGMLDALGAFSYMAGGTDPDPVKITFSTDYTGDGKIKAHETLDVSIKINGNEKAQLPVRFITDCPGATGSCTSTRVSIRIDALQAQPGSYTATVQVGTVASYDFPFTILPNHAPELVRPLEDQIVNAASASSFSLDLADYFRDPDGETPVFSGTLTGDDIVSGTLSGSLLTLTPTDYGLVTVTVKASDARGASSSGSFRLLARNTYLDLDLYPNPVTDYLHVRPASDRTVSVHLYNALGATVYSNGGASAGPFDPLNIDMRSLPGGVYTLRIGDESYSIAKK